ncbi:muscarinic acetylcholine receptor M1-like [Amphiura filiformis]|uniref:muscarinic acetylcholine receptor M1-like n=1 Tax=Amphiura filiformis TaxID=82378 RepID=UPI003B228BF6
MGFQECGRFVLLLLLFHATNHITSSDTETEVDNETVTNIITVTETLSVTEIATVFDIITVTETVTDTEALWFDNTTHNDSKKGDEDIFDETDSDLIRLVIGCIFIFFTIFTIFINGLVLVTFLCRPNLRTYFNYFLIGITVADFSVSIVSMPSFCGQLFLGYLPLSADMCVFFGFIDIVMTQASNQSVVMLSIDRYVSLARPLWHLERRTIGRVVKFMSIAYGLPLLLWLPIAVHLRLQLEHLPPGTCVSQLANEIWIGILIAFLYWVPFILLLIVNIKTYCVIRARRQKNATLNATPQSSTNPKSVTSQKIAHHVSDLDAATSSTEDLPLSELVAKSKKSARQLRSTSKVSLVSSDIPSTSGTIAARIQQRLNEKERKTKESERRAARTLTLLVVVMLITWTPYSVMVVIASFCPTCFPWYIYEVSLFLTCLNSAANPWCYAARNVSVRQAMLEIVQCKWLQRARRRP